jgi:hypothetical protein
MLVENPPLAGCRTHLPDFKAKNLQKNPENLP